MASKLTATIDMVKFKRDLNRQISKICNGSIKDLTRDEREKIGDAAIKEMKNLISKGISPISGNGRFPGYKWVEKANTLLSKIRGRGAGAKKKRADARALKRSKYPYSAMREFPQKKERPVNLKLSGKFLDNLKSRATGDGVEIGFTRSPYKDYESGHREGVHGQPKRPIIPQGSEEFTRSVYQALLRVAREMVLKRIRKGID